MIHKSEQISHEMILPLGSLSVQFFVIETENILRAHAQIPLEYAIFLDLHQLLLKSANFTTFSSFEQDEVCKGF